MLWSPVGTQENSFTPCAGQSFRDGLIHQWIKVESWIIQTGHLRWCSLLCSRWPTAMQILGWKNLLEKQSACKNNCTTDGLLCSGGEKKRIRVRSYLQSFQVYQSWRTAIKDGQTFLPLCSLNLAHSTCWWRMFLGALLPLMEQHSWTTLPV